MKPTLDEQHAKLLEAMDASIPADVRELLAYTSESIEDDDNFIVIESFEGTGDAYVSSNPARDFQQEECRAG